MLMIVFSVQVWREACAPLYHCRCAICERAMAKASVVTVVDSGVTVAVQSTVGNGHPLVHVQVRFLSYRR